MRGSRAPRSGPFYGAEPKPPEVTLGQSGLSRLRQEIKGLAPHPPSWTKSNGAHDESYAPVQGCDLVICGRVAKRKIGHCATPERCQNASSPTLVDLTQDIGERRYLSAFVIVDHRTREVCDKVLKIELSNFDFRRFLKLPL